MIVHPGRRVLRGGFLLPLFWLGFISLAPAFPAGAGTQVVSNNNDSGTGSLRQAIAAAASNDTIIFQVSGFIALTGGELVISKNLTITGPGAANLTIFRSTANGVPNFRIFHVVPGPNNTPLAVNISGLTISNGWATNDVALGYAGGDIYAAQANLTLTNCVITSGVAVGPNATAASAASSAVGGGLAVEGGSATITGCTFSFDSAIGGAGSSTTQYRNGATAAGGAIYASGSLNCSLTNFNSNQAIAGNGATDTAGAGGNGALARGGAVFLLNATFADCSFIDNLGRGGDGASGSGVNGSGGDARGAAIYAGPDPGQSILSLSECTLRTNHCNAGQSGSMAHPELNGHSYGGGIDAFDNVFATGCILFLNQADRGGGIYLKDDSSPRVHDSTIRNCTFHGNSRDNLFNDNTAALAIYNCTFLGGNSLINNVNGSTGTLAIGNSLFKTFGPPDIVGNALVSLGHNLSSDAEGGDNSTGPGGYLNGPGDVRNTDPQLVDSQPQDHGGPTPTLAVMSTSPVVDHGDDSLATRRDQRGYFRTGRSDIGAYEYMAGLIGNVTAVNRSPSANDVTVTFEAIDRLTYRLQRKMNITDASWQDVDPNHNQDVTATSNSTLSLTAPGAIGLGKVFYHVVYVSGP